MRAVDHPWARVGRCKAAVWKRDTYRYTGRVRGGFELHYTKEQCKRKPTHDGYCWQHAAPTAAAEGE